MLASSVHENRMNRRSLWALCAIALLPHYAAAQARLEIRTRSILQVALTWDGAVLAASGSLTDDVGAPIPGHEVQLAFSGTTGAAVTRSRASVVTDATGTFTCRASAAPDREWTVVARVAGGAHRDATESSARAQVRKTAVRLIFAAPRESTIELDQTTLEIAVQANAEPPPVGANITLKDELGRVIATGELDQTGLWVARLPTRGIGEVGVGKLVAETSEGPSHLPGHASLDVMRVRHSHVTVDYWNGHARDRIHGSVHDANGAPLPNQAVAITANSQRFATLLTNVGGEYSIGVGDLPRGQTLSIVAIHESPAPWWRGGHSTSLNVILPAPWRPAWWFMGLVALTSAGLLFHIGRPRRRAFKPTREPKGGEPAVDFAAATHASARGSAAIHGQIVDAVTLRAIPGVLVQCVGRSGERSTRSSSNGAFVFDSLVEGNHLLRFTTDGYAETTVELAIPHFGGWTGARIRMQSHRRLALRHYERGLLAWLGRNAQAARITTRDAISLPRGQVSASARHTFEVLTRSFERAYYGQSTATAEDVQIIGSHAEEVEKSISQVPAESFDAPRGPSL